jgi:hypothetical protein
VGRSPRTADDGVRPTAKYVVNFRDITLVQDMINALFPDRTSPSSAGSLCVKCIITEKKLIAVSQKARATSA